MDMRSTLPVVGDTDLDLKIESISADWEKFSLGYDGANKYFGEYFSVLLRLLEMMSLKDRNEIEDISVTQNLWTLHESMPINARNAFDTIYRRWDSGYDIWRTGEITSSMSKQFLESLVEYRDVGLSELREFLRSNSSQTLISTISNRANRLLNKTNIVGRTQLDTSITEEIARMLPEFRRDMELLQGYFVSRFRKENKQDELPSLLFGFEDILKRYPTLSNDLNRIYAIWRASSKKSLPISPDSPIYMGIRIFFLKEPGALQKLEEILLINKYSSVLKGMLLQLSWCVNDDEAWPVDDEEKEILEKLEFQLMQELPFINKIISSGSIAGDSPYLEQIIHILLRYLISDKGDTLIRLADKMEEIRKRQKSIVI